MTCNRREFLYGLHGGLGAVALEEPADDGFTTLARIQFWVLVSGISLYAFTRGFVFDRYLVVWGACLPLLWVRYLPRWLLAPMPLPLLHTRHKEQTKYR